MSDHSSYRSGLAFSALTFGATGVLSVVGAIVTARLYGVSVLGQYALAIAPVHTVWFLSTIQERPALVREITALPPRAARVTGLFAAVLSFSFALTVVVASLGMVVVYFVYSGPVGHPELLTPALAYMGSYVFLINSSFILDGIFSAYRAGRALFWIRVHEQAAFTSFAVIAYVGLPTVWGLMIATVAANLTVLLHRVWSIRRFMRVRVPRKVLRDGFRTLPGILHFGARSAPGAVADGVSNESGIWVLGAVGSISSVGAYSRAGTLSGRIVDLSARINEMLFPTLIQRRSAADHKGFDRALIDSVRYVVVLMGLPAAAGGGAAYGIMRLFGPGFDEAAVALAILLAVPALATVVYLLQHTLYAVDRPVLSSVGSAIRLVITLASVVPLSLLYGSAGTATAVLLGYVIGVAYAYRVVRPYLAQPLGQLWPRREVLAFAVAYTAGFFAALGLTSALPHPAGMVAGLGGGTLIYLGTFWLLGGVNERDRDRLREARGLAGSRRAGANRARSGGSS